eukprot:m.165531 g.165531  ORF g.165531 m.165531 type:complete len:58 (+) comp18138_c0_seq11:1492-1665(+)
MCKLLQGSQESKLELIYVSSTTVCFAAVQSGHLQNITTIEEDSFENVLMVDIACSMR